MDKIINSLNDGVLNEVISLFATGDFELVFCFDLDFSSKEQHTLLRQVAAVGGKILSHPASPQWLKHGGHVYPKVSVCLPSPTSLAFCKYMYFLFPLQNLTILKCSFCFN